MVAEWCEEAVGWVERMVSSSPSSCEWLPWESSPGVACGWEVEGWATAVVVVVFTGEADDEEEEKLEEFVVVPIECGVGVKVVVDDGVVRLVPEGTALGRLWEVLLLLSSSIASLSSRSFVLFFCFCFGCVVWERCACALSFSPVVVVGGRHGSGPSCPSPSVGVGGRVVTSLHRPLASPSFSRAGRCAFSLCFIPLGGWLECRASLDPLGRVRGGVRRVPSPSLLPPVVALDDERRA